MDLYEDNDPEWMKNLRKKLHKNIEWIVKFTEIVLLSSVVQYTYSKTKNSTIGMMSAVISLSIMFYIVDYFSYLSRPLTNGKRKNWIHWAIIILGTGYFAWSTSKAIQNVTDAIRALVEAQNPPKP